MWAGAYQGKWKSSWPRNGSHTTLLDGRGNPLKAVSRFPSKSILQQLCPSLWLLVHEKGENAKQSKCVLTAHGQQTPLSPADVWGWQWEHYVPVYSFIAGRNTIWRQFAPWQLEWLADLVEHYQMKDMPACKRGSLQSLWCLQGVCTHLWTPLSLSLSVDIDVCVCGIAVSYWAGVLREVFYGSAFFHLSQESVESHLFWSGGIFIYLFRGIQPWEKPAATDSTARMHLPIYSPLWFVAMLEIFSAFCTRCCCTLCCNLQYKELPLEWIWGF